MGSMGPLGLIGPIWGLFGPSLGPLMLLKQGNKLPRSLQKAPEKYQYLIMRTPEKLTICGVFLRFSNGYLITRTPFAYPPVPNKAYPVANKAYLWVANRRTRGYFY